MECESIPKGYGKKLLTNNFWDRSGIENMTIIGELF